jgi:hypothetical protein
LGLRRYGLRNTHIPNLVAVRHMRRCLRLELCQGRGLVNHLASVLDYISQGIPLTDFLEIWVPIILPTLAVGALILYVLWF